MEELKEKGIKALLDKIDKNKDLTIISQKETSRIQQEIFEEMQKVRRDFRRKSMLSQIDASTTIINC
jgi:hypothetical protein